jgi:hypothetical protein
MLAQQPRLLPRPPPTRWGGGLRAGAAGASDNKVVRWVPRRRAGANKTRGGLDFFHGSQVGPCCVSGTVVGALGKPGSSRDSYKFG